MQILHGRVISVFSSAIEAPVFIYVDIRPFRDPVYYFILVARLNISSHVANHVT